MNDPLKDAFTRRADAAADMVDLDAGLAGVHARNSVGARAARLGAISAVIVLLAVGVGALVQRGDDGAVEVPEFAGTSAPVTDPATPTNTTPLTSGVPPTDVAIASSQADRLTTYGMAHIGGNERVYTPGASDPIIDAFDDRSGGVVFQTEWGIFHRAADSDAAVFLSVGELLDVGIIEDKPQVLYTVRHGEFEEQTLFRRSLDGGAEVELAIVGGIEWGIAEASFTDDGIFLYGGDGFCSSMRFLNFDGSDNDDVNAALPWGPVNPACNEFAGEPTEVQVYGADMGADGTVAWFEHGPNGMFLGVRGDDPTWTSYGVEIDPGGVTVDVYEGAVVGSNGEASVFYDSLDAPPMVTDSATIQSRFIRTPLQLDTGQGPTHITVDVALDDEQYVTTAPGDDLNLRVGPGVHYPVVASLPDRSGPYNPTGEARELPDGSVWVRILGDDALNGWVNVEFMADDPSLTTDTSTTLTGTAACPPIRKDSIGPFATTFADVDQDGLDDTVSIFLPAEQTILHIDFGNGGQAAAEMTNFVPWTTGDNTIQALNLSHIPNGQLELIVGVGQGAAGVDYAIYALDGCDLVEPLIAGETFGLSLVNRASAGFAAGYECAYDTGALVEVVTHETDFNLGKHLATSWHLDGTTWRIVATVNTDFDPDNPELPQFGDPSTCA